MRPYSVTKPISYNYDIRLGYECQYKKKKRASAVRNNSLLAIKPISHTNNIQNTQQAHATKTVFIDKFFLSLGDI